MQSIHCCARSLRGFVLLAMSYFAVCSIVHAQVLTYELQPGSTITRSPSGGVTFPSEPLTGTFSWQYLGLTTQGGPIFKMINISFSSPSYSIQKDPSIFSESFMDPPPNIHPAMGDLVFLTGLSASYGNFYTSNGSYTGPPTAPTSLSFLDNSSTLRGVSITTYTTTSFPAPIADTHIIAVLVPEPSTFALLAIGSIGLISIRRRFF